MISLIIPTYRNPEYLDLCLRSAIKQQWNDNEIIVAVDGFIEESNDVLEKYKDKIKILDLGANQGMQTALNLAVMNATNEKILIVNDDNVFCTKWDIVASKVQPGEVLTLNQIEPDGPGIFNFPVRDFGRTPDTFEYKLFLDHEMFTKSNELTDDGGIFPFAMGFIRTHNAHLYHFGSTATKNGKEGKMFKATERPAAELFYYKWGISPQLFKNLSHNPKNKQTIKGIKFN